LPPIYIFSQKGGGWYHQVIVCRIEIYKLSSDTPRDLLAILCQVFSKNGVGRCQAIN